MVELFRLADKYVASGVHAKLKQILVSPSFLEDDPIWVYVIACHENLTEEVELAIPHTFEIDPVRDIPHKHLQTMTAETYNRLLIAHAARRDALISALDRVDPPSKIGTCTCDTGFYTKLSKDIHRAIWKTPVLDKRRLDSCLSDFKDMPRSRCGLGKSCRMSSQAISAYFASILYEVGELG